MVVPGRANGTKKVETGQPLNEVTTYLYQCPYDALLATSVIYPDGGGDTTTTTHNRLGWVTSTTDQRGVLHTYTYGADTTSAAGQVVFRDSAVIPPDEGIATTVQSIATAYDDMGRVQTITSCTDTRGTLADAVNQVYDLYDGLGQPRRGVAGPQRHGAVERRGPQPGYGRVHLRRPQHFRQ